MKIFDPSENPNFRHFFVSMNLMFNHYDPLVNPYFSTLECNISKIIANNL